MAYSLGAQSRANMGRVDPRLVGLIGPALARSPVDFGVQEEQSRTWAEQAEKVRRKVSKTMNSAHVIKPGKTHSTGVDLVPWIDKAWNWGDSQWRVKTKAGATLEPFYDIAAAMQAEAIKQGVRIKWGAIWDRCLNDLPLGAKALKAEMEAYKVRHPGPDFVDGPHFELV